MRSTYRLTLALLLPMFAAVPVQQPEPGNTTISGQLFVDLNGNGAYDPGELALAGIPIEFANGEQIVSATTDADGAFSIEVAPGLWRAVVRPPVGFEYALPEGLELEVLEAGESQLQLTIGLQPVQLLEVLVNSLETGTGQEPPVEQTTPSEQAGTQPEVFEGPFVATPETVDPVLLPESGSALPPRVLTLYLAGGMLVLGLGSWTAGRMIGAKA